MRLQALFYAVQASRGLVLCPAVVAVQASRGLVLCPAVLCSTGVQRFGPMSSCSMQYRRPEVWSYVQLFYAVQASRGLVLCPAVVVVCYHDN